MNKYEYAKGNTKFRLANWQSISYASFQQEKYLSAINIYRALTALNEV